MFFRLFLLFALVPLIEIYLFIEVGSRIGALNTVAVVILTALLGAWLARAQGVRVLENIRTRMAAGQMPADQLIDGAMILAAGLVLLTPGFFTDALGFGLLVPQVRAWIKEKLKAKIATLIRDGHVDIHIRR